MYTLASYANEISKLKLKLETKQKISLNSKNAKPVLLTNNETKETF